MPENDFSIHTPPLPVNAAFIFAYLIEVTAKHNKTCWKQVSSLQQKNCSPKSGKKFVQKKVQKQVIEKFKKRFLNKKDDKNFKEKSW